MDSPRYNIIFSGQILPQADLAQVKANLARLFKSPPAAIEKLFGGQRVVIKRDIDPQTAKRYQLALKNAGVLCEVHRVRDVPAAQDPDPAEPTIAPPGTVLVSVPAVEAPEFDLSTFTIAEPGVDLVAPREVEAYDIPETTTLEMDPPGVDIVAPASVDAPEIGDLPDVTVAAPGEILVEPIVAVAATLPDISAMSLSDTGVDLVEDGGGPPPPAPPDTSGLSLEPVEPAFGAKRSPGSPPE